MGPVENTINRLSKSLYIIIGILAIIVIWLVVTFNRIASLEIRSNEALSDIDVQLKRRFDLIPNLVETVKGYMTHEKEVLENVTKARSAVMAADGDPINRSNAENQLSATLKTLFAVSENYPDLKANVNFLDLQREIADTENKIQASRRFYNGNVREFSIVLNIFPSNMVAKIFGFKEKQFFEVENEEERKNVKVEF